MRNIDKSDIAKILQEIANLLEYQGENPYKIRSYRKAAKIILTSQEEITKLAAENRLTILPGIGKSLAATITTFIKKGRLPYLEKLKQGSKKGLLETLNIPHLGKKRIDILYKKLKIRSLDELKKACLEKRITKLKGFGKKTSENILNSISQFEKNSRKILWWQAYNLATPFLDELLKLKSVKKAEFTGSLRRKMEVIESIDLLVISSSPSSIINWLINHHKVAITVKREKKLCTVQLKYGIQMHLYVVSEDTFAFASFALTGSFEHTLAITQRFKKKGLVLEVNKIKHIDNKVDKRFSKIQSEKEIYQAVNLAYIPPELRENKGEIEAFAQHRLPHLVEASDIKGVFHCHTLSSDGNNSLEEMCSGAEAMGWEYIGISDHSKSSFQAHGMDENRLFEQMEKIHLHNRKKTFSLHIFTGIECDILPNGDLDFANDVLKELDFVIVSIHRSFKLDEKTQTMRLIKAIENPYVTMIGHLTGRLLLRRDPYLIDVDKVIDACLANGKIIELNAHPARLDMDWRYWHKAKDKGLLCSINPDAHSVGELQHYLAGVNMARKGWIEKDNIINTYPLNFLDRHFIRS